MCNVLVYIPVLGLVGRPSSLEVHGLGLGVPVYVVAE